MLLFAHAISGQLQIVLMRSSFITNNKKKIASIQFSFIFFFTSRGEWKLVKLVITMMAIINGHLSIT